MSDFVIPSKEEVADMVVAHSCTRNCLGIEGNSAGCCTMGSRDYIIGPIPDAKAFLKRYRKTMKSNAKYDEIFIDYKEGSKLFPDLDTWQNPDNFPAIRVKTDQPHKPCMFLGENSLCSVHAIRSKTCSSYSCDHVKHMLEKLSLQLP